MCAAIDSEAASRGFLTSDEREKNRKIELEEDLVVFKEMLADGTTPFGSKHMPIDIARMIAQTICPDTLLKEEIELLKSEEGQAHLYVTMLKDAHATEVLVGGGRGIFRRKEM